MPDPINRSVVVETDPAGHILNPLLKSFRIGYLGRLDPRTNNYSPGEEPRANWIPPSAEVIIDFQAADAVAEGSKEVDLASRSDWDPDPVVANGRQFIRWRIRFNVAKDGSPLSAATKRPVVQEMSLDFDF